MHPANINPASATLTDAEIVRRIVAGDRNAFVPLMRRYNQILYRTARSVLKDDGEAEDAVQEAYLLAYRNLDQYRGDAKLATWLVRIVLNEALARLHKRRRRAEVIRLDGEYDTEDKAAEDSLTQAAPEQPEHGRLRSETRRILERKIDDLPDAFRTVFMLRAVEELTVEETAAALDLPPATVRTRFFRARGLLREALARELDGAIEDAFSFAGARCDRIVAGVLAKLDPLQTPDA